MGLKIFAIVLVLFLAEIVFLTTKDFKEPVDEKKEFDYTDISFENINSYEITKDGITSNIQASKLLKYADYSKVYDIKAKVLNKGKLTHVKADKALLTKSKIHLMGDVSYENNNSIHVKSQDLVYNSKTDIITIDTPFILETDSGEVKGNHLVYNQKDGNIKAKNIYFKSED
jgi:LPS export ABC transporter protein LptC